MSLAYRRYMFAVFFVFFCEMTSTQLLNSNIVKARKLNTARCHLMPQQHYLYYELGRSVDYCIDAREWTRPPAGEYMLAHEWTHPHGYGLRHRGSPCSRDDVGTKQTSEACPTAHRSTFLSHCCGPVSCWTRSG